MLSTAAAVAAAVTVFAAAAGDGVWESLEPRYLAVYPNPKESGPVAEPCGSSGQQQQQQGRMQ